MGMMKSNTVLRLLSAFMLAVFMTLAAVSSASARFLSPDTWDPWMQGVDFNRYAYANDDPINLSDPNGHQGMGDNGGPPLDLMEEQSEPDFVGPFDDPVQAHFERDMQRFMRMQRTLLDGAVGTAIIETQKPAYRLRSVLSELQDKSGRPATAKQRSELADDFKNNRSLVNSVSGDKLKAMRQDFEVKKNQLIGEWEQNTGRKWPRYSAQDIREGLGGSSGRVGQRFDAHHVRQLSDGGRNSWWNIHPVTSSHHTGGSGIHSAGSAHSNARSFFSRLFGN
jgi:5-methylcytosine-specific restriction endonuclease McrA